MNEEERELITDLQKCDFNQMNAYYKEVSEKNKNRSKEEKKELKEKNEALIKEYGFCIIDGHKEKIGNFRLEPPGLFRGKYINLKTYFSLITKQIQLVICLIIKKNPR